MKSMSERIRDQRVRELYLQRQKASQNQEKPPQIRKLTQEQMDEIMRLRDEQGFSREIAVQIVLAKSNIPKT